ncbi:MAG: sulfur carrier protein ThiS [Acidobacteria bacterium]|nr:sulfur carrier protein ThiS [Acidobacteriota bacterium]
MSGEIRVAVNGEAVAVAAGTSIATYVESLRVPPGRVAVERNGRLVPKGSFAEVILAEGDRLEVVTLVGGG